MYLLSQFATLAMAGALLVACSGHNPVTPNGGTPANPAAQPGAQNSTDASGNTLPDFNFTPTKGGGFSITLPGHGTQGYQWHLVTGFDASVVTPLNPGDKGTSSRTGSLPANAGIGQSASEIFDFKALNSGTTRLVFSLYRSWEGPDRAGESRTFNVTVQ